jgi:hypothetical protein
MSVHEAASGLSFFLQRLRNDPALMSKSPGGVQFGAARVGTVFPCTIVTFQSGIDVIFANGKRAFVDALYICKALGPSSDPDAVVALASQIDDTLGGDEGLSNISVTGGFILACRRESIVFYTDEDKAGTQFTHMGGAHRIKNQQKPI